MQPDKPNLSDPIINIIFSFFKQPSEQASARLLNKSWCDFVSKKWELKYGSKTPNFTEMFDKINQGLQPLFPTFKNWILEGIVDINNLLAIKNLIDQGKTTIPEILNANLNQLKLFLEHNDVCMRLVDQGKTTIPKILNANLNQLKLFLEHNDVCMRLVDQGKTTIPEILNAGQPQLKLFLEHNDVCMRLVDQGKNTIPKILNAGQPQLKLFLEHNDVCMRLVDQGKTTIRNLLIIPIDELKNLIQKEEQDQFVFKC